MQKHGQGLLSDPTAMHHETTALPAAAADACANGAACGCVRPALANQTSPLFPEKQAPARTAPTTPETCALPQHGAFSPPPPGPSLRLAWSTTHAI